MKLLLSLIIVVALVLNLLRLNGPLRGRAIFSLPFWIYLAWIIWSAAEFHYLIGSSLLGLMLLGRKMFRSPPLELEEANEEAETESSDEEEVEDDDEELSFSFQIDAPDPRWRSRFPNEEEVLKRLAKRQHQKGLRSIRKGDGPWFVWPEPDRPSDQERDLISAFLANIEEYSRSDRDLESTLRSLDHLATFAPEKASDGLQSIIENTPESERAIIMNTLMTTTIWSNHAPRLAPPEALVHWVRSRLSNSDREELEGAIDWLVRHDRFDWETDGAILANTHSAFLAEKLYWSGSSLSAQPRVLFRFLRDRYSHDFENETPVENDTQRKLLWQIAARLKFSLRSEDAENPAEDDWIEFKREASDFLTRELRRIPRSAYETHYHLRTLWEAYARGAEGPEADRLLAEIAASSPVDPSRSREHTQIVEEALAALARKGGESTAEDYLRLFADHHTPKGADFLMDNVPRMRGLIRDHLLFLYSGSEPISGHPAIWQLRFLLRHANETVLEFFRKNAERLPTAILAEATCRCFRQDGDEAAAELQRRQLLHPKPLIKRGEGSTAQHSIEFQRLPHTTLVASDSDEYPPRYDNALREFACLSAGGFPVERVRQRTIPWPLEEDRPSRIEISWILDDRRCHFLVDHLGGDWMNIRWLLRAANSALEATNREERFFGLGDDSSCFHVVFGTAEGWIEASGEFGIPLLSEPEMEATSEEAFRERLLKRYRKLVP